MEDLWIKVQPYIIEYSLKLLAAAVIFIVGKWAAQVVSDILETVVVNAKIDKTLARFCKTLMYYGILAFVCIAALNKLGVETSSFIAIVGAAGLAVGLALQGSLANFAAGVMLILFRPFHVGDTVETTGVTGIVDEIQIFSTIVMTEDKKKVIIPNSKITGDKIIIYPKA